MAISISNYTVYLQDGLKLDRDCLKSQESQNEGRKIKRSQGRKRAV